MYLQWYWYLVAYNFFGSRTDPTSASHSAGASTTPEPLFGAGTTPSLFVHNTVASNTCKGVVLKYYWMGCMFKQLLMCMRLNIYIRWVNKYT